MENVISLLTWWFFNSLFRFKWVILNWGKCTASCGTGTQSRVIACMRTRDNNLVANAYCPRPVPQNKRECYIRSCYTYKWTTSDWGKCSQSCGGGLQKREVNCIEIETNKTANNTNCQEKMPFKLKPCNLEACDIFEWHTLTSGQCSKTCDGGLRIRLVYCVNKDTGGKVPIKFCTGPSPPRIEICNIQKCPTYSWQVGKYGECSATCGSGTKTRDVFCMEETGGIKDGRQSKDENCIEAKPVSTIDCRGPPCPR